MGDAHENSTGDPPSCPDAGLLVSLARGTLGPGEREGVESHVRACAECSEVLRLWTAGEASPAISAEATGPMSGVGRGKAYPPGPGDILAEKYRVERVLGIGGMGVVVAATHLQLGRTVALKLMLPQSSASAETSARFIQEARAASEVQSEHVARVLDVGTLADGAPFMVMEFLRGSDFAHLLRAHGPLPVIDVAGYVLQACEAVAEAHALGIVHRDLKPANLFLTTRVDGSPLVKVLDFGISKLTRAHGFEDVALTKSQTLMGTPLYMSPEQLRSTRTVGPATDIWSLGCILYELLAGHPAFQAESAQALGAVIAAGPAPRIRDVRPDVPSALQDAILLCLEKDPAARPASVGELARLIGPFAPPDMAHFVARVARISHHSHRVDGQLPYANTQVSERPPQFSAATGASFARSSSGAAGRHGARTRLVLLGVALAVVLSVGLTISLRPWGGVSQPSPAASGAMTAPVMPPEVTSVPLPPPPPITQPSEAPPPSLPLPARTSHPTAIATPTPTPTAIPTATASTRSPAPSSSAVDPNANALFDRK
jgi:eukaryotic-like serine/threonine-protein kinase